MTNFSLPHAHRRSSPRSLLTAAAVSVLLCLGACGAASSTDDGVVLRTQDEGTIVTTVELDDGSTRTVLLDEAGEERAEAIRDADGEFSATLDGEPWAPAALDLLALDDLHETLHAVGLSLPDSAAASPPIAKADGANDAVVPGFYWQVPNTLTMQINTCKSGWSAVQNHEFTGEVIDSAGVYEVTDVTPASYTVWHRQARGDGSLMQIDADDGEAGFIEKYHCTRAGATFASCTIAEITPSLPPLEETVYLARWDRAGGGWRMQLDHSKWTCDPVAHPGKLSEGFCSFIEGFWGFEQLPCDILTRNTEYRPTGLPVIDEP